MEKDIRRRNLPYLYRRVLVGFGAKKSGSQGISCPVEVANRIYTAMRAVLAAEQHPAVRSRRSRSPRYRPHRIMKPKAKSGGSDAQRDDSGSKDNGDHPKG